MLLFTLLLSAAESSSSDDGESEKSEDEDAEDKPKTKTIKETTYEWELLNDVKAIWLRNPKEVTEEEYTKFYHSLAKVICQSHLCISPPFYILDGHPVENYQSSLHECEREYTG